MRLKVVLQFMSAKGGGTMKAKILVAEDDESLTSFLQPMLKRAGFQVTIA